MISRNALAKCAQQAMKFQHAKTLAFGYSSSKLSSFSDRLEPQQANKLTDIGIRKIFEHEHDMYRETCRKFYDEEVKPYHDQWEEDGNVSREVWKKAGEQGMLCVSAPEKYGGLELDCLYAAVHWEEQAYSNCLGPGFFLHNEIAFPYFLHYGSEEQKQRYLPAMIKGDIITAIAMTEPGAGSDLQGMRTNAVKDGDYYIINGSKTYITNGWMSDVVIVCVKTDLTVKGSRGISLFLIDADTPGFKKGKKLKKMGMKAQDTSELFFEDVRVHKSTLLGQENKGFTYLMSELPQERLQVGIMALSSAEACFEWTRTFVKERKAFGGYLSDLQVIRHKLAEMKSVFYFLLFSCDTNQLYIGLKFV